MNDLVKTQKQINARNSIYDLQECLQGFDESMDAQQCEDEYITHFFAPGVYARQMFIPAGLVAVGKIHKTAHVSIISCGKVSVTTENGTEIIEGPYTFINTPGEKRAVYAHTDTVWTTIHPTDETDIRKIEKEVIANDYEELEGPNTLRIEGDSE
jgi:hypothetical protein